MKTLIAVIAIVTLLGTGLLIHFGEHESSSITLETIDTGAVTYRYARSDVFDIMEHDPGYAIKLEGGLEIHP